MKTPNKRKKGFTLIECIVAFAIVTVVSTSAVVIYQSVTKSMVGKWDNYAVTVSASNVLSVFKASDNTADFANKLSAVLSEFEINKASGEKNDTVEVPTVDSSLEYDLSQKMSSTGFGTIKAVEETKKVTMLNSSGNTLLTLNAGDSDYTTVRDKISGMTSVYNADKSNEESIDETEKIYIPYNSSDKTKQFDIIINKTKKTITITSKSNATQTSAMNEFEEYIYITKGWYLEPNSNSGQSSVPSLAQNSETSGYLSFFVKEQKTNNRVQYNGSDMLLQMNFYQYDNGLPASCTSLGNAKMDFTSATKWQDVSTKVYSVTYYNTSKNFEQFKKKNYTDMSAFIYIYMGCSKRSMTGSCTYGYTAAKACGLKSTTYTLKSDYSATADILYAEARNTSDAHWVRLYNSDVSYNETSGDNEGKLIYEFKGTSEQVTEFVNKVKSAFNLTSETKRYVVDGKTVTPDTANAEVYSSIYKNNTVVSADKIKVSSYNDSSTSKMKYEVSFLDSSNVTLCSFEYTYAGLLESDLASTTDVTVAECDAVLKNTTNTKKEVTKSLSKKGNVKVQYRTENDGSCTYTVYISTTSGGTEEQTKIFTSHATLFAVNEIFFKDQKTDVGAVNKIESTFGNATTSAYYYSLGDYSCFVITTFSDVVNTDAGIQPQIKIWLLSTDKIPTDILSKMSASGLSDSELNQLWDNLTSKLGKTYLTYQKG